MQTDFPVSPLRLRMRLIDRIDVPAYAFDQFNPEERARVFRWSDRLQMDELYGRLVGQSMSVWVTGSAVLPTEHKRYTDIDVIAVGSGERAGSLARELYASHRGKSRKNTWLDTPAVKFAVSGDRLANMYAGMVGVRDRFTLSWLNPGIFRSPAPIDLIVMDDQSFEKYRTG